MYLIQV